MPESQVRIIADLMRLPFEDKHINARKALIHQTDPVQIQIYVLPPQGRIPSHRHSRSWDIAIVLDGRIDVTHLENGRRRTSGCRSESVIVTPPGIIHEIRNPSQTVPARFLLIQSPSKDFDFLPAILPREE